MYRQLSRWKVQTGKLGQVALEYALTTVIMALVASLLYIFYQPLVQNVFFTLELPNGSGGFLRDFGIGLKEILFLPLP